VLQAVARDAARQYSADDLVANANNAQTNTQEEIGKQFAATLSRTAGGPYFCGPSFDRAKSECPAIQVSIVQVEYADPGIQAARNEKQKALEEAAAQLARAQGQAAAAVAEAKGKADAAKELAKLYSTPGWLELQKQIQQAQALVEACKAAAQCNLFVGSNGQLILK
jgi:regulator of protease activity HflC (stomatin/prohibitin superfamily)